MNKKIVIIGGLSAGPSAAAKARREDENAEIILFEKTNHISYATCGIPYALSGKIKSRDKLMVVTPELLRKRFKIDVHLNEPVIDVNTSSKEVSTKLRKYPYDELVFATGGIPLIPTIKNLDKCTHWSTCKTIEDFDKINTDKVLENKKNIAIIGAGLIGLEAAENLSKIGKTVHIIEKSPNVLPILSSTFSQIAKQVLVNENIHLHLNRNATEFNLNDKKLYLDDGNCIDAEYLIIGIGVRPNTDLLPEAEKAANGALVVDSKMRTSLPNIYAAGDCVILRNLITEKQQYFPMGTHSNKGGRTAGAHISGKKDVSFDGAYGTSIVQIFDYAFARTGLVPCIDDESKSPYKRTLIVTGNTPGFYPNPSDVVLCIYYHSESQIIVGAELFGKKGIDKRIDVLSTAIYAKLTLHDLQNLDLAYAPSFSPAKDPVIIAAYSAQNELNGRYNSILPMELLQVLETASDIELIDVRNYDEIDKTGKISGAKNIPLDTLRENLNSLPHDKDIYVYCARGQRGYVASKILANNGFNRLYNLAGGILVWKALGLPLSTG